MEESSNVGVASPFSARARRRRRRANAEHARTERMNLRLTPEEVGMLALRAGERGVSPQRFLMEAAFAPAQGQGGATVSEFKEAAATLFGVHRLLGGIANNVNQLARVANSTGEIGEVGEELSATLEAVRRTSARIDATLEGMAKVIRR